MNQALCVSNTLKTLRFGFCLFFCEESFERNFLICFQSSAEEPWFQGTRFMSIFQLVLRLPSKTGTEKDLVQETDR